MLQQVQRRFPPPTSQFRFSPERVVNSPAFAHKMIFASEGPLTVPPSGTTGDSNAHRESNTSGPQGISTAFQKPRGEWNRPSKGYSLAKHCSDILGWGMGKFTEVERSIHALVDTHLDHTRSRSAQDTGKNVLVREAAVKQFPFLAQYEVDAAENWLINSFIARRLKWWKDRQRSKNRASLAATSRGRRIRKARPHS